MRVALTPLLDSSRTHPEALNAPERETLDKVAKIPATIARVERESRGAFFGTIFTSDYARCHGETRCHRDGLSS
jgi:hypothetical protein